MKITALIPYSSLYPKIGKQLVKGLSDGLAGSDIDLQLEYTGEGSTNEIKTILKKLISSGPDLIIAVLSKFQRQAIAEGFDAYEIPLIAIDSGEFFQVQAENEFIIPYSLKIWEEVYALGRYSATLPGTPLFNLDFYESGYPFMAAYTLGLNHGGKEDTNVNVDMSAHYNQPFNEPSYFQKIESLDPSIVIALVSGKRTSNFLKLGIKDKFPPIAVISTSVPLKHVDQLTNVIVAIKTGIQVSGIQELQPYYQAGKEVAIMVSNAVAATDDPELFLKNLSVSAHSAYYSVSTGYDIVEMTSESGHYQINKILSSIEFTVSEHELHTLGAQYQSGFDEPYLGH